VKALAAALVLSCICAPAFAAPSPAVAYRLAPVMEPGALAALKVEMRFAADADGETRLELPKEWGGGEKLWRFVHDLQVSGAASVFEAAPETRVIKAPAGVDLTVSYTVSNPQAADPGVDGSNFSEPIIRPDWLYVIGDTIFAQVEGREQAAASFAWAGTPAGWTYVSDLEQLKDGRGKVNDVVHSLILAAPDLKVETRRTGGAPVRVAVRGAYGFDQKTFSDLVVRIVAAERDFWKGGKTPFLVTLAPLANKAGATSLRGTNLEDGFAVIATPNTPLEMYRVLLTHEYFHTWNPVQVGGLVDGPQEPKDYWASEGFTDFYARRLALRYGLIDLQGFADAWNEALARYWSSGVNTTPNARMVETFWADEALHKLPYDRGSLLAVLFDKRIRDASGGKRSMDDVMFAMRDLAGSTPKTQYGAVAGLFPIAAKQAAGLDFSPEMSRYVERGEPVLLPADAFGGCITVKTLDLPAFDRGFDGAKSAETGIISGVDPAGPAFAAGMRDGFKRVGREGGKDGDSRVEIGYRVIDASGQERLIRYRPEGKTRTTLQELEVASGLSAEAQAGCARAVAGGQAAAAVS